MKLAYLDEDASGSSLGLVVLPLLLVGVIAGPTLLCSGHAWLGALVLSAVAIVLATAHARGKRVDGDREARLAGALGEQPFPVVGFLDWLLADRPLADVTVEAPIDAELFASAVRVVDARATVEWLGPCRARIALSPRLLRRAKHRAPELRSGDLVLLRALIDRVLVPLHAEVRIARLELGGEANAAPPGER